MFKSTKEPSIIAADAPRLERTPENVARAPDHASRHRLGRSTKRSLVKALTYRVAIVCLDFGAVYLLTGKTTLALGFMIVSNVYTTVGYFLHERIWAHIQWGRGVSSAHSREPPPACPQNPNVSLLERSGIVALLIAPVSLRIATIEAISLVSLGALGGLGGRLGGAPLGRASLRVTIGGALAMSVTAAIGRLLGVSVG